MILIGSAKQSLPRVSVHFLGVCSVLELQWYRKIHDIGYLNRNTPSTLSTSRSKVVHDFEELNLFTSLAIALENLSSSLKHVAIIVLSWPSNKTFNYLTVFSMRYYSPYIITAVPTTFPGISLMVWMLQSTPSQKYILFFKLFI